MRKLVPEAVHESTSDLHKAGVMGEMTMRKFDALCLPEGRELNAAKLKWRWQRERARQGVFAASFSIDQIL